MRSWREKGGGEVGMGGSVDSHCMTSLMRGVNAKAPAALCN